MKPIEFDNGAVQIDAAIVAEGLGLALPLLQAEMRAGRITSLAERGVDTDLGRHRLTFFSEHRRFRVVVDEATDLGPLLRAAADHPVAQAALAAAAIDRPRPAPITPAPPDLRHRVVVDGLSQRELDVLRLLRSDLSGPEIARELTVSLNTVRTHTKNIYMKLGVNNRRQAVSRAAELGL